MKKFFLLMALVLTAGVVQAQNTPNFGNRANLKQAKKAPCNVYGAKDYSWDHDNKELATIFNDVQTGSYDGSPNIPTGQSMASTYENFVIRVSGLSSNGVYSVQFLDEYDNVLHTFTYYKDDVHISPLRALFTSDEQINRIHKVKLIGRGNSGSLTLEEAYFISALQGLDFTDKDGVDIGNAYIDPSYLIRSNRIWVDINPDRSFYINIAAGDRSQTGTLSFSLPYLTGIDVSDVSFTATDFDRTADVFNRYIVENKRVYLTENKEPDVRLIRKLYNSRYSGAFYDENNFDALNGLGYPDKARQHANSIYWQAFDFPTTSLRRVWVQDICLTKNRIEARPTRKGLALEDFPNPNAWGFRNREYPVQPYYNGVVQESWGEYEDWSDIVRGDWNKDNTYNFTDLSKYNKMRIIGSPNTKFVIRYATELEGTTVVNGVTYHTIKGGADGWKEFVCKTDARGPINENLYGSGEVNIDLDVLKAGTGHLYLQCVRFDGLEGVRTQLGNSNTSGLRSNYWCNNVELFEGEGRLVDLVGSTNPNDTGNMYHVWNNDNNYQWQYGTVVRWACPSFESHLGTASNMIWGTNGLYAENYADLTGYKAIRVYGNIGEDILFVFNTMRNGDAPWLNPNSSYLVNNGANQCKDITISIENHGEKGNYAELNLSNYEFVHLNGIKAPSGATVTAIKLVEDEESSYIFYGNGSYGEQGRAPISYSARMAANDLTATVIDSRARCNNMQVPYPEKYPNSNEDWFGYVEHITLPQTASQNVLMISRHDQFNRRKIGDHLEYQVKSGYDAMRYDPDNIIEENTILWYKEGDDGEQIPVYGHDVIFYEDHQPKTKIVDDVEDFNLLEVSNDPSDAGNFYTCTNLKLVDGLSFYAPKKIKAETATYTRTFNNANTVNTIIIPFAVDAGSETAKKSAGFYVATNTLQSVVTSTSDGKNMVGILGEQEVNEGDWLLQFSKYTGTTDSNVPYLYAVTDEPEPGKKKVFTGVATENGKVIIKETPDVLVEGKLRMSNYDEAKTLVNGEMKEGYYLRGVYEGTYMEDILFYSGGKLYRTPRTTVTPFRTIIHSPIPVLSTEADNSAWKEAQDSYFNGILAGNVKVVLAFDPDDDQAVAIENVEVDGLFAEDAPIYNVAGQRVNTLEKGIYIVAGKKILVK